MRFAAPAGSRPASAANSSVRVPWRTRALISGTTRRRARPGSGVRYSGLARGLRRCLTAILPGLLLATFAAPGARAQGAADATALTRLIDGFLAVETGSRPVPRGRALLVPVISDTGAGAVAGRAFARLSTDIDRVVLVAPRSPQGDAAAARGIALPSWESMRTALGEVKVDAEGCRACQTTGGLVPSQGENAAEGAMAAVLPFLQRRLPKAFRLVPLAVGAAADPALLAAILKPLVCDERTAIVVLVSSPLSPEEFSAAFGPTGNPGTAAQSSVGASLAALHIVAGEMGWRATVAGHGQTTAGQACLAAVLVDDPNRVDLLAQAAKVTWDDPATLAAFQDAGRAAGRTNFQGDLLSQPEQQVLLGLARKTIHCKLKGEPPPAPPLYSDTLSRPAGCFVTLNQAGKLRGCIGTIVPKEPLAAAVQHYALAAALEDKRFPPVTLEELAGIEVQISVLSVPTKLEFRDGQDLLAKLTPGVHGVLLTHESGKRATFLPQVWGQFPDKAAFLSALCRKGGVPADAWQDPAKTSIDTYESFDFTDTPK